MALSEETKAILDFLADRFNPGIQAQMRQSREEMQAIMFPLAPVDTVPVRVPCVHPNGYKFTAIVAPSKTYEGGRWVGIEDEQWPTDAELCASIDWWHKRKRFTDGVGLPYNKVTELWLYDHIRLPILRLVGKGPLPIDWREDMQEQVKALRAQAQAEMAKLQEKLSTLAQPKEPEAPPDPPKGKAPRAAPAITDAK